MSGKTKVRIDQLLVERGLAESRARAQALILAGHVFSGETKLTKAGHSLAPDAPIEVRGRDHPWVSRGGIKLAHALAHFGLDPAGVTAMDIGSSTGGFTDVLLTHGAAHVFAVDSGTNQLAWKLRQDPRVTVLEQTSARVLTPAQIDRPATWVVCDASFIGLRKVLEVPLVLAARPTRLVALIKPQFEVGRGEVGKGGVVRDAALHRRVCGEVQDWLENEGWAVQGIAQSPITGPEGNVEFLISAMRHEYVPDVAKRLPRGQYRSESLMPGFSGGKFRRHALSCFTCPAARQPAALVAVYGADSTRAWICLQHRR